MDTTAVLDIARHIRFLHTTVVAVGIATLMIFINQNDSSAPELLALKALGGEANEIEKLWREKLEHYESSSHLASIDTVKRKIAKSLSHIQIDTIEVNEDALQDGVIPPDVSQIEVPTINKSKTLQDYRVALEQTAVNGRRITEVFFDKSEVATWIEERVEQLNEEISNLEKYEVMLRIEKLQFERLGNNPHGVGQALLTVGAYSKEPRIEAHRGSDGMVIVRKAADVFRTIAREKNHFPIKWKAEQFTVNLGDVLSEKRGTLGQFWDEIKGKSYSEAIDYLTTKLREARQQMEVEILGIKLKGKVVGSLGFLALLLFHATLVVYLIELRQLIRPGLVVSLPWVGTFAGSYALVYTLLTLAALPGALCFMSFTGIGGHFVIAMVEFACTAWCSVLIFKLRSRLLDSVASVRPSLRDQLEVLPEHSNSPQHPNTAAPTIVPQENKVSTTYSSLSKSGD